MIRFEKDPIRFLSSLNLLTDREKILRPGQYFSCLNPVLYFYGWNGNEALLREILPDKFDDFELHDLLEVLTNVGLEVRKSKLSLSSIDERTFPCLLVDKESRDVYVALERRINGFLVYSGRNCDVEEILEYSIQFDAYFLERMRKNQTYKNRVFHLGYSNFF